MEPNQKNDQLHPDKEQQEKLIIKMYEMHSGKIQKAGWYMCPSTFQGVFIAEFTNQVRYMYFPVPKAVFDGIFKAPSKGKYFTEHIEKGAGITYQKIGQPKMDLFK